MPTDTLYAVIKEALTEGNFSYLFPNEFPKGIKESSIPIDEDFINRVYRCLIDLPVTARTCYAYNFFCHQIHPNQQYFNDEHFIFAYHRETGKYPIEYGIIYILNKGASETPIRKSKNAVDARNSPLSETIANYLTTSLVRMFQDANLECRMKLICDIPLKNRVDPSYHSLVRSVSSRNNTEGVNPYVIADQLSFDNCVAIKGCLQHKNGTIEQIVDRYNFLKTNTKHYFEIVKDFYLKLFQILVEDKLLGDFTPSLILKVSSLLEDIYNQIAEPSATPSRDRASDELGSSKLQAFKDLTLATKVLLLHPKEVQYYLLGFPIQLGYPSAEMFSSMLRDFNLDPDAYLRKISTYNLRLREQMLNDSFYSPKLTLRNTQDSLFENFEDYSPRDIIPYVAGNSLYIFSRPELKTLCEQKKNFLTNEKLRDSFLDNLETLQNHSFYLPASKPLKLFYEELAEGKNLSKMSASTERADVNERIADLFTQLLGSSAAIQAFVYQ